MTRTEEILYVMHRSIFFSKFPSILGCRSKVHGYVKCIFPRKHLNKNINGIETSNKIKPG